MNASFNPKTEEPQTFQDVKRVMSIPADSDPEMPAPWTESDFTEYLRQEPLPPNQSFMLPAEEQPTENENQLHLNYL